MFYVSLTARAQTAPATAPSTTAASTTPAPLPKVKKVYTVSAPTTAVDQKSCTTPQCHPEEKNHKFIHGPVNVDACDACHTLTDPAKHTFQDARPKEQLCTFCHKMDIPAGVIVHAPVKSGDCLGCHDPHGGKTAKFIRGDTMRDACDRCHQDVVGKKTHVHGPVAAGVCEACHSPHFSKYPKLLLVPQKDLCLSCHKEMGDQLRAAKVAHKPVLEGDCTGCHDPHATNFNMQIKAEPFKLCTSCHDKIKALATDSKYKHLAVTQDQACMNCHTPHGGPLAKLLKAQPVTICVTCHLKDQKTPDDRIVKAVPEVIDPKLIKHGPVRDGNCNGCHEIHGSEVISLLAKPYPPTFYAKFDPANFALCFSCHDKKLVEARDAEGLTGFRNGTKNLHFVHVDREKGRTCRACHEKHASDNPVFLRDAVPFGQWELPINFKKTETGGSCAPGCHKQYGYDRNAPVDNHVPAPAADNSLPSPPTATPANQAQGLQPLGASPATQPAPSTAPAPAPVPTPSTPKLNLPK